MVDDYEVLDHSCLWFAAAAAEAEAMQLTNSTSVEHVAEKLIIADVAADADHASSVAGTLACSCLAKPMEQA